MTLQLLPGLGLPQKMPPFFPIFSSSPPSSYPLSPVLHSSFLIAWSSSICRSYPRYLWGFLNVCCFTGWRSSTSRPTPNLEDQGVPFDFDWAITLDLSSMGGHTGGLALRIPWPHKPPPLRQSRHLRGDFVNRLRYIVGSRFTTELRSRIFGCKSNRRKTSTI